MRKSSFGGGRPSISGAPLRVRNENTPSDSKKGRHLPSSSKDRYSSGRLSYGTSKLPVGNQRRSVSAKQFSFVPKPGRPSSGIGVRGRTDIPKEPRPVSDKRYQNQCIKQLLEFLMSNQYPHPISQKLLASPSSKDFFKIFEFIYGKFSRGYKQVPKMEEEVPSALKMLGYPFALSKMYLFSVGSPHSWPHLLAALIWMIDLLQMTESINDHGGIEAFIFEPTDDNFDGISEDKIIFDYCETTYEAFMSGADTFEEHDEALEQILMQKYQGGNIEDIIAENARLEAEVDLIDQGEERQRKLQELVSMTKHDSKVVQTFLENMQQYKKAQEGELQKRKEEYEMLKSDLESEKEKLSRMQAVYQQQELTPADVERLKAEQEGLKQQVEHLEKQIANIDTDNWNITMEQAKVNEKVEMEVATYNRLAIALKLVPETAELANGKDFRLRAGFSSDVVSEFENNVKPMLTLMKKKCTDELRRKNKEKFQLACELEQLQETVSERKEKLTQMERELGGVESEIESMKQLLHSDKKTVSEEVESLRQELCKLDTLYKQADAQKIKAAEQYHTNTKVLASKKEDVRKQLAELQEARNMIEEHITEHVESIKRQMSGYVKQLETVNKEMDKKISQSQEQSRKREEWLASLKKK